MSGRLGSSSHFMSGMPSHLYRVPSRLQDFHKRQYHHEPLPKTSLIMAVLQKSVHSASLSAREITEMKLPRTQLLCFVSIRFESNCTKVYESASSIFSNDGYSLIPPRYLTIYSLRTYMYVLTSTTVIIPRRSSGTQEGKV